MWFVAKTDHKSVLAAMREVAALVHFPPGLLPLIASFLPGQSIVLAGGFDHNGRNTSTALCYSQDTRQWRTDVPSMLTAHYGAATVAIGGRMMVFGGGMNAFEPLATCQAFDPDTNEWSALPPMSTPRILASAAVWQGRAFIFGGRKSNSHREFMSSAECFDPTANRWSAIAPMGIARVQAVALAIPGRGLLVMGGWNKCQLSSAELYDPATDAWTVMTWQLPKPLYDFVAHCIDRVIYVIAGCAHCESSRRLDSWSMDLRAAVPMWSPLSPPPTLITGLASTVLL